MTLSEQKHKLLREIPRRPPAGLICHLIGHQWQQSLEWAVTLQMQQQQLANDCKSAEQSYSQRFPFNAFNNSHMEFIRLHY